MRVASINKLLKLGHRLQERMAVNEMAPPGLPSGVATDKKGKQYQLYRKVWIDRDKYSPLRGIDIHGKQEADAPRDEGPHFAAEESRPEESAGR